MIRFGRDICGQLPIAEQREWLVTNGIGGFASGTVAGPLTRRYHGLLTAALKPPVGRTLLVTRVEETATYCGRQVPLFANRWAGGVVEPDGYRNIELFYLDGTTPVWHFALGDALLEKRIWMQPSENTTYVRYRLLRGSAPIALQIAVQVNYRDFHSETRSDDWKMNVHAVNSGLKISAFPGATSFYILSREAAAEAHHEWNRRYFLIREANRGLTAVDDNLHAATLSADIAVGDAVTLAFSTEPDPELDGAVSLAERRRHEAALLARCGDAPEDLRQLVLAADQFVVRRPLPGDPNGSSIIAGYHWFADWGRDTMIALPGLTLTTGRPEVAAKVLRTFAHFVDAGMLPNRFPDAGEEPEYNTVDATLWYFEALRAYYAATGDRQLLEQLMPTLSGIIAWHRRGTRYAIKVDPEDGLLYAGEPGVQLTWMDAKVDDWVVTPRQGKPVEINALWYNALRSMAFFARELDSAATEYDQLAEQAQRGFTRFWNEEAGYCYDVVDAPGEDGALVNDDSLRPNQLLAVSLAYSPLSAAQQKQVVDVCARELLTSHGLRSLAPGHPRYQGSYGGSPRQRDGVYHQGTVWAWLIGPFVEAHWKVHADAAAARSFLEPLLSQLGDHGIGSISEIFEGDPPFMPRGAVAQAWSVAEVLRTWRLTQTGGGDNGAA